MVFASEFLKRWHRSTFGQALVGAVLLWAALPPLDLWPLAWIAPVWWIMLIRREKLPLLADNRPPLRARVLLGVAALYFLAGVAVNAWFHSMKYELYWIAETVFWLGLFAIFLAAARLWKARPYYLLWLAGMLFWMAALHWLRLPHWAVALGWLALGIYFGAYLPVFVGLSRVGVHVLRLPVMLVVPVVYTGMELAQAHLLSGMTMACLEHSQYRWTGLIQISDLTGCYGVTFLMMFVAACLARMLPCDDGRVGFSPPSRQGGRKPTRQDSRRWAWWPLIPAAGLLAATLAYGHYRTSGVETDPGLKIALIQGSIDVQLGNPEGFWKTIDGQYSTLTRDALNRFPEVDLVVWPETVFCRLDWITGDKNAKVPPDYPYPPETFLPNLERTKKETCDVLTEAAREFGRPMIVGVDRRYYGREGCETFNSAVYVTLDGSWCKPDRLEDSYYDKTHLVPFGEYMPFVKSMPWLQSLTPLCISSSPGERPRGFMVKNICLVPNICYETVLPHVIRSQLRTLRQAGLTPQILVNVTNDGWFWGSSELEQHLACGVYRSVECRRPMVIAANTGISASIDGDGRILEEGPRRKTWIRLADVRLDRRESWYLAHGDWFAGGCLLATIMIGSVAIYRRFRR